MKGWLRKPRGPLRLHIKLLGQYEGSKTFTSFIGPLLPKNRSEQPC